MKELLSLADRLISFSAEDAFAAAQARTEADREAVRAELQRLVAEGQLRLVGGRYLRARAA